MPSENPFIRKAKANSNLQAQPQPQTSISTPDSSSSPSLTRSSALQQDTQTKLSLDASTSMLTSNPLLPPRTNLPLPNAQTKHKLVRALVDVRARAVGCFRVYLRLVDGDRGVEREKRDGTKEIVRWLEARGARIP